MFYVLFFLFCIKKNIELIIRKVAEKKKQMKKENKKIDKNINVLTDWEKQKKREKFFYTETQFLVVYRWKKFFLDFYFFHNQYKKNSFQQFSS